MDNELEVIHTQMEATRASLADKIEALEDQFFGPIEEAKEAVTHTVETVEETVDTVKQALDLRQHVEHHPWLMLGGAVTVGCLGGYLMTPSRGPAERPAPTATGPAPAARLNGHARKEEQEGPSTKTENGPLDESLRLLKELVIGSAMGVLRDMLTQSLPDSIAADAATLMDDLTSKLGGKPLGGSRQTNDNRDEPQGSEHRGGPSDAERHDTEMGRKMGAAQGESQVPVGFRDRR